MKRLRRLRSQDAIRDIIRETVVTKNDLVYPVFVKEGTNQKIPVDSMPGIYQYTIDRFEEELDRIQKAGVKAILIFGIPNIKMPVAVKPIMKTVLRKEPFVISSKRHLILL